MMVWEKGSAGLTVSSGFRWKWACGQMTSFQPAFHIPASLLACSHKTHHHKHTNCGYGFILTNAVLLYMPAHVSLRAAPITLGYVQFSLTYLTETQKRNPVSCCPFFFRSSVLFSSCFNFYVISVLGDFYFVLVHWSF